MKITFGRIFDTGLIAKTKSFTDIQPFVEWLQQAVDNIARALTSSITIADNIDANFYTQRAKGNTTSVTIDFKPAKPPRALIVAQQSPTTPMIDTFTWEILPNGSVRARFVFLQAPTSGVDVVMLAFNN